MFTGVGVALVTLFDSSGAVDAPATAEHAARLVELVNQRHPLAKARASD